MCSERDRPDKEKASPQIEVTPEMLAAGLEVLREHHLGDDLAYLAEALYLAMFYRSAHASSMRSLI